MHKFLPLVVIGLLTSLVASAQDDIDLFNMSLEELMNVEIVSASKKEESLFEAPVSSSVITRDEIARSGATTLPEALRLSPGLIVRETSNGNHEVFVRGFDNLHRYGNSSEHHNLYTLVMIDNRPVFNYNLGGTYWESLPVDLVDIERIEIVRGPNAPLFGPNAVTGVINIITRHPEKQGIYVAGNVQYGSSHTQIANLAVGMKVNDHLRFTLSGNRQRRDRQDASYYVYDADTLVEAPAPGGTIIADVAYPNPELALEKQALNAHLAYEANDHVRLDLSVGAQEATTQRFSYAVNMPLAFNNNDSRYVNVAGEFYGIGTRLSHTRGYENLIPGSLVVAKYDFDITDAVVDYRWDVTDRLSLRPAFNYQWATYDDTPYLAESLLGLGGLLNSRNTISTVAGSLRGDYQMTDHWRLISALRADKFSYPDDAYVSYQFASTYQVGSRYLLRAAHSRSNSGAFLNNTINVEQRIPRNGLILTALSRGNPALKLAKVTMSEIGFRGQLSPQVQLDMEVFRQRIQDTYTLATTRQTYQPTGLAQPALALDTVEQSYINLPLTATQHGISLSVNYVPSSRLQIRPFITLQRTDVRDLSLAINTLPLDTINGTNPANISTTIDTQHQGTPHIFGGAYVNVTPTPRLNANVNAYFSGQQTTYAEVDQNPLRNSRYHTIPSKLLLNAKVSYRLVDKLRIYGTVKNLMNDDSREYYGTDRVGRSFLGGVSYNF